MKYIVIGLCVFSVLSLVSARLIEHTRNGTIPCGGSGHCSDNSTCCSKANPPACCPLTNGVCCTDGKHCCPQGTRCGTTGCLKKHNFHRMDQSFSTIIKTVICPDHTACYDNQVCCQLKSGKFGCCPYDKGICCKDGEHCCPHGYHCDSEHQKCVKDATWFDLEPRKHHSLPLSSTFYQVTCPNPSYKCDTGSTCCYNNATKGYGCCPYENAVCCSDGVNCCPQGYYCDMNRHQCVSSSDLHQSDQIVTMPLKEKEKAIDISQGIQLGDIVCPDQKSLCQDGTTCCQMSDGSYGCCPYDKASCCNDHVHCCPNGFACDTVHGACKQSVSDLVLQLIPVKMAGFSKPVF